MIKKIKVSQLKPGMFVHDFACGWLENPFFKSSLLIKDDLMVEKVILHGIHELFIDTEKGIDAEPADLPDEPVVEELPREIEFPASSIITMVAFDKRLSSLAPKELGDELPNALKVREQMESALGDIFMDVSSGHDVDISATQEFSEKMVESVFRNDSALPCIAKVQKPRKYLVSRALNVTSLMIAFAKHLGLQPSEIVKIAVGALLHDVGMLKIDQNILQKPDKITPKELNDIKIHVLYSYEIIYKASGEFQPALQMALLHHERYDGSGYSQGIAGEQIPKTVRMLSIADIFDAMTTSRVYSGAINLSIANRKLLEMAALKQIDETLVQQFIRCIGIYPVGTIVRLSSGKIGIVIKQNPDTLLKPVVKVIYDGKKDCFIRPRDLDLADLPEDKADEKIASTDSGKTIKINPLDFLLA